VAASSDIRDAIYTVVNAVSGVGLGHKYEVYYQTASDIISAYRSGGTYAGFHIRRIARQESELGNRWKDVTDTWEVRILRSIVDAGESEIAFDTMLDSLCDALRAAPALDVPGGGVVIQGELNLTSSPQLFANGVACHFAVVSFNTKYRTQRSL
jgi:hypothetical protein